MTNDYTHPTSEVRAEYLSTRDHEGESAIERAREFDRWFRKIQAAAWASGNQSGWCEGYSHSDPEPNPYL